MINIMRGDAITITGDHGYTQVIDGTITADPFQTPYCQDVADAITLYTGIISDTISAATALEPTDYLGSITRTAPTNETAAGIVDGVVTTEWTADKEFPDDDLFVSNRINPSSQDRFKDAADLIRANATVIVDEAAGDMLARYPDLVQDMPRNASGGSTLGTLRCKTDLGLILDAIAEDIEYGGNAKTVQAFKFYLGANGEILHIRLQLLQSLYTHERLAFYAKAAIDGTLVTVHSNAVVIPPAGITNDAAVYLASLSPMAVGADTWGLGAVPPIEGDLVYYDHVTLIKENGIYILETMNTGKLAEDNVTEFLFVLGQPKLKGAVQMIINPVALW